MFLSAHNFATETDTTVRDPYWKEVTYFAKYENATTQDDAGIISPTTNGTLSLTTGKFGKALQKNSGGNYLTLAGANNTAFNMGTGDFTIEYWVLFPNNYPGSGNYGGFCLNSLINGTSGTPEGGTWTIIQGGVNVTTNWRMGFYNGYYNSAYSAVHPTEIVPNVWTHFACCRYNGNIFLFINGAISVQGTMTKTINTGGGSKFPSDYYNEYNYAAYFDDVRVTKGIARYTQSFAPPTKSQPTLLIP